MASECLANSMGSNNCFIAEPVNSITQQFLKSDDDSMEPSSSIGYLDGVRLSLNLFNHVLILAVTVAMSWRCIQMKLEKTAMHAYLCTLGFVFLLAEGTMMRYNANIFTHNLDPLTKTKYHFLLQLIGGILGCAGTAQKSLQKKQHFKSWHGKFGIAACIFFVVNLLVGLGGFVSPQYRRLFATDWHRFLHTLIGVVTFFTAMVAQYLGYNTGFMRRNISHINWYKFCTIIIIILTVVGPLQMLMWRFLKLF